MGSDPNLLKKRLKEAGFSNPVIDAAWPSWWSDEALASDSAKAELRFSIARKLGISPKSLFHDEVEFVWKDEARFKHLADESRELRQVLAAFGNSVARILVGLQPELIAAAAIPADTLRQSILQTRQFIDLQALVATCWALAIPVIHLRVFPQRAKNMHAMVARSAGRHAILLARDAHYPAPVAFTLAHEIGHIMLGHVSATSPLVDGEDYLEVIDDEEEAADAYALELLLGTSKPDIQTSFATFNAAQLADAVLREGPLHKIEPGTLALCLAHKTTAWPIANAALQSIYTEKKPVWREINGIAAIQLKLATNVSDAADYIQSLMGVRGA